MQSIGSQLAEYRKKNKLSQNEMGVIIGISGQQVGNIEKGGPTRVPVLEKIQSILEGSPTIVTKTESWYQAEFTRLNKLNAQAMDTIEKLTNLLTNQLGKLEGTKMLPIEVDTTPLSLVA